jgi:DNA-binding response OmpR family regulator
MEAYSSGELASLARRTIRILVIDDNLQEQQILRLKLEALGVSVIQVRHGRMAIMTAQKAQPDIVLLELETPDMPGIEVLRNLKTIKATSDIPVICISSSKDDAYRMRTLRLNADWYLSKPFRFSELVARLRYHAQEIASRTPTVETGQDSSLHKVLMRTSVDTLSDVQDVRKALHGLKGYVGADDYYLNSKLEICFRNLMRIESRLKEFRDATRTRNRPSARLATGRIDLSNLAADMPTATETPDMPEEDDSS